MVKLREWEEGEGDEGCGGGVGGGDFNGSGGI